MPATKASRPRRTHAPADHAGLGKSAGRSWAEDLATFDQLTAAEIAARGGPETFREAFWLGVAEVCAELSVPIETVEHSSAKPRTPKAAANHRQHTTEAAEAHRDAAHEGGRPWECDCGNCRVARRNRWVEDVQAPTA